MVVSVKTGRFGNMQVPDANLLENGHLRATRRSMWFLRVAGQSIIYNTGGRSSSTKNRTRSTSSFRILLRCRFERRIQSHFVVLF
ncbi:hypothetical protein HanIR_Chr13g0647301 [Helianthus annuus]|nr:hypothetical protein HanIR_Chr13g0647301 [Helianthus annuus]